MIDTHETRLWQIGPESKSQAGNTEDNLKRQGIMER